jgi:selenide,water dikinase
MDGVRDLAAKDLFPSGSRRNYDAFRDQVEWGATPELDQMLLCDAQTSGGLLVAIPQDNAGGFEDAMRSARFPAVRIGVMRDDGSIRLH